MNKEIILNKRNVKYPRIEIENGKIRLIIPYDFKEDPDEMLKKYDRWINSKLERLEEIKKLSEKAILLRNENIKEIVDNFVNEYYNFLGVKPEGIYFRKMKKRWASCNTNKKKIIFDKNIKFLPQELIKYIVLHEMAHLVINSHNKNFWDIILRLDKNYKEKEILLSAYRLKINNCFFNKENKN
jgi:predicted metal-dependent hydrolase